MLLDTSGLLSYVDADDSRHGDAVDLFGAAERQLTHTYVLAEFIPLCTTRGYNRQLAVEFSSELLDSPLVEVIYVDERLHREALLLLQARTDKFYSLCDAVSFVLMRERGISEALTTDRHFEQEGFHRLLAP